MKKLFFALVAVLALAACEQHDAYKLIVTMPDTSTEGDTLLVTDYDSGDTLSFAVIKDKNAVIDGELNAGESRMVRLLAAGRRVMLVLEAGDIHLIWADGKATGTPLNDKLNALDDELTAIESAPDSTEEAEAAIEQKLRDRFFKAFDENRDNAIGTWAFVNYLMYNEFSAAQIDSLVSQAPTRYANLRRVVKARKAAVQLELTAVGKTFTDFATPDGKQHLSEFVGKGQYALVDFWASWCGPCRREIPNIKALYDRYKDRMTFLGVAVWDKPDDTHAAMTELQIPWTVLEGGNNWTEPTDIYGINGIPHIMLIDPEGKIVARGIHGDALTAAVDAVMK